MTARIPGNKLGVFWGGNGSESTLEVFFDFNCPFSTRIFRALTEVKEHFGSKLELVFLPTPQPWHPSSCMVHECYHAATILNPSQSEAIMAFTFEIALVHFSDVESYDLSRKAVHEKIAALYSDKGLVDKAAFLDLVKIQANYPGEGEMNGGNQVYVIYYVYKCELSHPWAYREPTTLPY